MQQYFVKNINGKLRLKDEDYYHLVTVLRADIKRKIICVESDNRFLCEFSKNKDDYDIEIIETLSLDNELEKTITLSQALIKSDNFELVLQKAVELGVSYIEPVSFERSVLVIKNDKLESKLNRYNTIMKNASEQSHRDIIPECLNPIDIKNISLDSDELGIVAYEKCEYSNSLFNLKDEIKRSNKIKVVVGPEGGITEAELKLLINKGFKAVSLGKRILRSETASINLLSILGYLIEIEK